MYEVYTTDAFVIQARYVGENDRIYHLMTREYGLIVARATGVRKLASKLRYQLQLFRRVQVALIRGRDFWRITGAESPRWSELSLAASQVWAQIGKIAKDNSLYQQPDPVFFQLLGQLYNELARRQDEDLPAFLLVAEAYILRHLGYWNNEPLPLLENTEGVLSGAAMRLLLQAREAVSV